jgi:hypothetical protein
LAIYLEDIKELDTFVKIQEKLKSMITDSKGIVSCDITYVDLCIAFIADAPVLNASTVSVVAFAASSIIIYRRKR